LQKRVCDGWRLYDLNVDAESFADVYGADGKGGGLGGEGVEKKESLS